MLASGNTTSLYCRPLAAMGICGVMYHDNYNTFYRLADSVCGEYHDW